MKLERALNPRPVRWYTLLGVVLIPILILLTFVGATWGSQDRWHRVEAAVVNNDEMVTVNGQAVPLGRQLAAELSKRSDSNLNWVLADEENAASGMESGRFVAVVRIPKEFSAAATSYGGDADKAHQAVVSIETSRISGIADTTVAQQISESAQHALNTTLTETYLDNIYLGFNETGKQFQTVADASGELADGGQQVSDGINQSAEGAGQLATGLDQAAAGAESAATGATQLASGVRQSSDGANQLAGGLEQLSAGSPQLRSGTGELATGADQLATGMETMAEQTKDLPAQTQQLAGGARELAGGTQQLAGGAQQLADSVNRGSDGQPSLRTGVTQYVAGVNQLVDGMAPLTEALGSAPSMTPEQVRQAQQALGQVQSGTKQFATSLEGLAAAECPATADLTDEQRQSFCAGWAAAVGALNTPDPQTGATPIQYAQQLGGSAELGQALASAQAMLGMVPEMQQSAGQLNQLKTGGEQLVTGVNQLGEGTEQLATGANQLSTGANQLADGTDQLAGGLGQLSSGIQQSATGSRQLATGAGQLATGVNQYTTGVDQTATGSRQLATGMGQLSTGADQLSEGISQLATGVSAAAEGQGQLSTGLNQLNTGGKQLADGQRQLADGLAEGASKIPTYSDLDRANLKEVVANPIADTRNGAGVIPDAAWLTLVLVLALWLGALGTYTVLQAVPSRLATSTDPNWKAVLKSLLPGLGIMATQAVALTVLAAIVLDMGPGKGFATLAFLLVAGMAFVLINHALVAWFGGWGRLISGVLAAITAAAGLLSAVPAIFDVLTAASPLTPVLHGVRAIVTDSSGVTEFVLGTVGWLVLGLVASVLAVLRARTVNLAGLLKSKPGWAAG